MTTRKSQNSILVLATLGVYLGLVLVGATPQILAQAAMTKQFNVKDEIEVRDDLDKKPGESADPIEETLRVYLQDFEGYLGKIGETDRKLNSAYSASVEHAFYTPCRRVISWGSPIERAVIGQNMLPDLLDPKYSDSDWGSWRIGCYPSEGRKGEKGFADVELEGYNGQLTYSQAVFSTSTQSDSSALLLVLSQASERIDCGALTEKQRILWNRTQFVVRNNLIFIVTCLPRSDLNSLLAPSAK